jgi:Flp pilus assembly protein TadG
MNFRCATRQKRQQAGHVMLEMALCFLPLMAIVCGIIDFSMVIFMQGAFQNATREAVRFGITYDLTYGGTTYGNQTGTMTAVAQANSFGFLSGTLTDGTTAVSHIKVNYYTPDNLSTPAKVSDLPKVVNNVTISALNQTGNVVEVAVTGYPWNWMVPLPNFMPGKSITIRASSLDVLQGLPTGTFTYPSP